MKSKAYTNGGGDEIWTPGWFFDEMCERNDWAPRVDLAACARSTLTPIAYHKDSPPWAGIPWGSFWCNPPWSDPMPFVRRYAPGRDHHAAPVLLLPRRVEGSPGAGHSPRDQRCLGPGVVAAR